LSGKVYEGTRDGAWVVGVTVDGQKLFNYDKYGDPKNGFEWGYGGGGPYALALSILSDHYDIEPYADPFAHDSHLYRRVQQFKEEVVAHLPRSAGFILTSEKIAEWIANYESASRTPT